MRISQYSAQCTEAESRCGAPGSTMVLGGGLAGLSAAYALARSGRQVLLSEADSRVGGLSKTMQAGEFRYDLGGHRFFTHDRQVESLVLDLMGAELRDVPRSSKIFLKGRFFDYPLRPGNALTGLGLGTVAHIVADYIAARAMYMFTNRPVVSLEDWVVGNFGRKLYDIYFKEYSEKVWGLECSCISQSWVSKRIQGLSLSKAMKNAFFKVSGRTIPTLADRFYYPAQGIGRIAERFEEEIAVSPGGRVCKSTAAVRISHNAGNITGVDLLNCKRTCRAEAGHYVSTIPLDTLVRIMQPEPPEYVMAAARALGFRDLVLVAVMVDKPSVTDQSWVYIPEKRFAFGRMHEPKVWSADMAPEDKSLVVLEFFCTRGDTIWESSEGKLSKLAVDGLVELGFLNYGDVIGTEVLRIPKAYPLFEVGYEQHCKVIFDYLSGFRNLSIAGRGGSFAYQNMDHAIASGLAAAAEAIAALQVSTGVRSGS